MEGDPMETICHPSLAAERAMKIQEIILRAIAVRLKWYQAAEILGISDRQMRRLTVHVKDFEHALIARGVYSRFGSWLVKAFQLDPF
jgi:hypothetical protein